MRGCAMLISVAIVLVAGSVFAGPPINGAYQSTDLGGPVYILFPAFDRQLSLAGGDLNVERFAQKTEVAVGRAEQLELLVG